MEKPKQTRNFKPVQIGDKTYPVFYNGRRVLIFDSTTDKEMGLDHSIVLWDKVMGLPMCWADQTVDGAYEGFTIYGPHEIQVSGSNLSELAADCLCQHLWSLRN
jgi:hypothetical protein